MATSGEPSKDCWSKRGGFQLHIIGMECFYLYQQTAPHNSFKTLKWYRSKDLKIDRGHFREGTTRHKINPGLWKFDKIALFERALSSYWSMHSRLVQEITDRNEGKFEHFVLEEFSGAKGRLLKISRSFWDDGNTMLWWESCIQLGGLSVKWSVLGIFCELWKLVLVKGRHPWCGIEALSSLKVSSEMWQL